MTKLPSAMRRFQELPGDEEIQKTQLLPRRYDNNKILITIQAIFS